MTLLLALAACSGIDTGAPPPDVLLITLDTTRADRLGAWGYERGHTPFLDGLAERGRRYDRAYSPVPLTIPSHASLLTGRYPASLQVRANGDAALAPSALTLAEHLSDHGYRTAAAVGAFVTTRVWGFQQGFDTYLDAIPGGRDAWRAQRPGAEVVDDLLAWERQTRAGREPRFGWAHLYDPHHPYVPWPEHAPAVDGRPYDAELSYVDAQVERLVRGFSHRPTLVVVVGDHGESLGEHAEQTHGLFVYDTTQRVPWIVAGPGISEGEVVSEPVSLVDVAPTLLAQLDLPALPSAEGRVVPGSEARPVFVESWQLAQRFGLAPHLGVVDGRYKLIDLPRPELYDLLADPDEHADLSDQHPEVVARLRQHLADADFAVPRADPAHAPSPEIAAQLAELGYVDAGVVGRGGPRPDPKDHVELLRQMSRLDHRVQRPEHDEETAELLRSLVVRYPHITELRTRLAAVLARLGRPAEAASVVKGALERDPDNLNLRVGLATQLASQGRFAEAAELYREAADAMPWQPRLRPMTLMALIDAQRPDEAADLGLAWLEESPTDPSLAGLTGVALVKARRFESAMGWLEEGLRADPPERGVAYHLSAARMGAGRPEEAAELLDLELRNHPGHVEAVTARAHLYARTRDWDAQLAMVERAVEVRPESPALLHLQAQTLYNLQRFDEARTVLDRALRLAPGRAMLLLLDANLLRQEGRADAAVARFEEAKAARAREEAAASASP